VETDLRLYWRACQYSVNIPRCGWLSEPLTPRAGDSRRKVEPMSTVTSADGLGIPRGVRRVRQRLRWSGRGRRLIPTCRSSGVDRERCCGARPPPASTTARSGAGRG
jgi:hypothetical protein